MNLGVLQTLVGTVMSIFFYTLVIAGVWKLFQVATDIGEIKTLLQQQNRAPLPPAPAYMPSAGPISLESAEALLREVAAESEAPKTTV